MSYMDNLYPSRDVPYVLVLVSIAVLYYGYSIAIVRNRGLKAPLFGFKSLFEPAIVAKHRFFRNGKALVAEGYAQCKDSVFKLTRNDADIAILSNKYMEELRSLPASIASPTMAHAHNLLHSYTQTGIILESDLHFRLLQTKLTPNLGGLAMPMQDELDHAMSTDFPSCKEDWVALMPYHVILRIVARISARIFVGLPFCRRDDWLEITTEYTENVFVTVTLLRLFPSWLHPFIAAVLPARWRLRGYINHGKKILVPEINRRRAIQLEKPADPKDINNQNLLQWMMDTAQGWEGEASRLAHLETVISLASIHTTQMAVVHVLYDLCERPEYVQPLREEIEQVIAEDKGWQKVSFNKMRKLDSFMKESQRFNPPSILAFHRVMLEDYTLSDGTRLPKGTHFCMASQAIQNDASVTESPNVFDGFRYYKMRQNPVDAHRHQFATTEPDVLNFGHGKYSCPGRFFASLEIKNILVRLLMNYDFKLPDGQKRPQNLVAHEYIFPNPDGKIMFKERAVRA